MTIAEQWGAPPMLPSGYTPSLTTWRMFCGLPLAYQQADAAQEPPYPLLAYLSLVGDQMGQVETLLDLLTYISPADGGPAPGSGALYSISDLVDPWQAQATWLPWLAMVAGVNITGMNQLQARLAIAARPTYGSMPGSKWAMQEAVRTLFAFQGPANTYLTSQQLTITLPVGLGLPVARGNLLNPAESSYVAGDPTYGPVSSPVLPWTPNSATIAPSQISYQGAYSLGVSGASPSFGVTLARQMPVIAGQTYELSWYTSPAATNVPTLSAGASVLFYGATGSSLGASTTSTGALSSGTWSEGTLAVTMPPGTTTVGLSHYWTPTGSSVTATAYLDLVTLAGPDPYGSLRGSLLFGPNVPLGASVTALLGQSGTIGVAGATVDVEMSQALPSGVNVSTVAVVPNVPVAVLDHYSGNWGLGVLVPAGVPLSTVFSAAMTQKPAGYSLSVLYSYADWESLYTAFGDGANIVWSEVVGLSWLTWEQTT